MDGGAWWAAVHGVAKSRTRLSDFTFIFTFMRWRRKWQPTPVFLPGESQGQRSWVGCHLWGHTESDTAEATWQQQQQDFRRGGAGGRTVQEKPCRSRPLGRDLAAGRSLRRLYRFGDLPSSTAAAAGGETPTSGVATARPLTKGRSSLLTARSASASAREFGGRRCSGWSWLVCLSVSALEK